MDYAISLDQTSAVTEGMKEIIVTLLIAIVLVILVVFLFFAGLAGNADPDAGRACLAGGHVYSLPAVRLLHQYAFNVWVGSGDRPRGR